MRGGLLGDIGSLCRACQAGVSAAERHDVAGIDHCYEYCAAAVLLANHGPVVAGKNLEAAVYATEELEETAKLYLLLRGENPRGLTPEQVAELEARFPRD